MSFAPPGEKWLLSLLRCGYAHPTLRCPVMSDDTLPLSPRLHINFNTSNKHRSDHWPGSWEDKQCMMIELFLRVWKWLQVKWSLWRFAVPAVCNVFLSLICYAIGWHLSTRELGDATCPGRRGCNGGRDCVHSLRLSEGARS